MDPAERLKSRQEYNEAKELENLKRVFDTIDKNGDAKIDLRELTEQLGKLEYRPKRSEIEDMIWEVDEDCDKCVSWEEFKLMFHRCRNDKATAPHPTARRRGRTCALTLITHPARRRRDWSRVSCSTWSSS